MPTYLRKIPEEALKELVDKYKAFTESFEKSMRNRESFDRYVKDYRSQKKHSRFVKEHISERKDAE